MKNNMFSAVILGASLALLPAAVFAQTAPTAEALQPSAAAQESTGPNHFSMVDKHFLKAAAQGGLAEVKLGQLAADKGGTDAVKEFGNRMVKDHSALNDAMKPFVEKAGLTVPTKLSVKNEALYDRLNGLHGAAFDSAYIASAVKDHVADQADFAKEAASTKNEDLRDAVKQGDQTIKIHLAMARKLSSTHGKSDEAGT
jgi:putative membrane protein